MKMSAMMRLPAHRSLGLHAKGTAIPRPSKGILLRLSTSAGWMDMIEPVVPRKAMQRVLRDFMDRIRLEFQASDVRITRFSYCEAISYTCMVANMNLVSKHMHVRSMFNSQDITFYTNKHKEQNVPPPRRFIHRIIWGFCFYAPVDVVKYHPFLQPPDASSVQAQRC